MKHDLPAAIVANSWRRLKFTDQVTQAQFDVLVGEAQSVGFLRDAIPLDRMFSRKP
jgi:NitT/TauT family transport system substrate-binding protein